MVGAIQVGFVQLLRHALQTGEKHRHADSPPHTLNAMLTHIVDVLGSRYRALALPSMPGHSWRSLWPPTCAAVRLGRIRRHRGAGCNRYPEALVIAARCLQGAARGAIYAMCVAVAVVPFPPGIEDGLPSSWKPCWACAARSGSVPTLLRR